MSAKHTQVGPLPNIVVSNDTKEASKTIAWTELEPKRQELVLDVAQKYPHFLFWVGGKYVNIKVTTLSGERVGEIERNRDKVCLRSPDITKTNTRGHLGVSTADVKKASKLFKKYFRSPTELEIMRTSIDLTGSFLSRIRDKERSFLQRTQSAICDSTRTSIDVWCNIIEHCTNMGVPDKSTSGLLLSEATELATPIAVSNSYKANGGYNVCIRDAHYFVHKRGTQEATQYTTDTLPGHIKQCVGMLKLVPVDTVVDGVGAHVSAGNFYVLEEQV